MAVDITMPKAGPAPSPVPAVPQPAAPADPTTLMLDSLKKTVALWGQLLSNPVVRGPARQAMADKVLYLYEAMMELAPPPVSNPAPNGNGTPDLAAEPKTT